MPAYNDDERRCIVVYCSYGVIHGRGRVLDFHSSSIIDYYRRIRNFYSRGIIHHGTGDHNFYSDRIIHRHGIFNHPGGIFHHRGIRNLYSGRILHHYTRNLNCCSDRIVHLRGIFNHPGGILHHRGIRNLYSGRILHHYTRNLNCCSDRIVHLRGIFNHSDRIHHHHGISDFYSGRIVYHRHRINHVGHLHNRSGILNNSRTATLLRTNRGRLQPQLRRQQRRPLGRHHQKRQRPSPHRQRQRVRPRPLRSFMDLCAENYNLCREYVAIGSGASTSFSQTLSSIDAGEYVFKLHYKSSGEPVDGEEAIYSCLISASIGGAAVTEAHATGESTWDVAVSDGYWNVPSAVSNVELKVEISCFGDYNRVFVYVDDVTLTRVCRIDG
ncbi:hypothetical protein ACJ41O_010914 [Fusarium nematophilum]